MLEQFFSRTFLLNHSHFIFLKWWTDWIFSSIWKCFGLLLFQLQIYFIVFNLNIVFLHFRILFLSCRIQKTVHKTLSYLSLALFFIVSKEIWRKNHFAARDGCDSSSTSFHIAWLTSLLSTLLFRSHLFVVRNHWTSFLCIYRLRRSLLCKIQIFG